MDYTDQLESLESIFSQPNADILTAVSGPVANFDQDTKEEVVDQAITSMRASQISRLRYIISSILPDKNMPIGLADFIARSVYTRKPISSKKLEDQLATYKVSKSEIPSIDNIDPAVKEQMDIYMTVDANLLSYFKSTERRDRVDYYYGSVATLSDADLETLVRESSAFIVKSMDDIKHGTSVQRIPEPIIAVLQKNKMDIILAKKASLPDSIIFLGKVLTIARFVLSSRSATPPLDDEATKAIILEYLYRKERYSTRLLFEV